MLIRKVWWPVRLACLVIGGMWYLLTGGPRPNLLPKGVKDGRVY
jgi:hypothetical protein